MSEWSVQTRHRFLAQLARVDEQVDLLNFSPGGEIRVRLRADPPHRFWCPLTAVCWHALGAVYPVWGWSQAAEALAIPRGMAIAIQYASDGARADSPRRQAVLDWWRTQIVDALGSTEGT